MKINTLFMISYFIIGLVIIWLLTNSKVKQAQHIKTEYYIELRSNGSAIIEDTNGCTYFCPSIENIPRVLIKENL
jgi:hypothetical protein